MKIRRIDEVRRIPLPCHRRDDGELVVIEEGTAIPFAVRRTFTVKARNDAVRGAHAHKQCWQFLICVHGRISVVCDDGERKETFSLDTSTVGLLVPPTIWATETYLVDQSILLVLCDAHYDADDYLRDYAEFLVWRTSNA